MNRIIAARWAPWLPLLLLVAACASDSVPYADALSGIGADMGWTQTGPAQVFVSDNLYDLVNGQAEMFFAYAFEQATVSEYETASDTTVRVEIWQLSTPADAYGLFTSLRAAEPISVGTEGDVDPGRRLVFWQGRYFASAIAFEALPGPVLESFARAVADALPDAPEGGRPALVDRLPEQGLMERRTVFFHEEISIQSYLWLGGHNLLGLGPETDGVLAWYSIDGSETMLLLVEYRDQGEAAAGLRALQTGGVSDLAATQAHGKLLGVVIGLVDPAEARSLLADALGMNQ